MAKTIGFPHASRAAETEAADVTADENLRLRPGVAERIFRRFRRDASLVMFDLATTVTAYLVMLVLSYEGEVPVGRWRSFWIFMPVAIASHLLMNHFWGLYGQMWRYASALEARRLLTAAACASLLIVSIAAGVDGLEAPPISVIAFGSMACLAGFGAIRFQSRLFAVRRRMFAKERERVLVAGAGDAGAAIIRDILRSPSLGLDPVALVDDDPRKRGRSLMGVPVVGSITEIPTIAAKLSVDQVLLAIPSATGEFVRRVAAGCEDAGVALRVLPSVRENVGGRVTARDIRDLRIEDLLGRQQVEIDLMAVGSILSGKTVLVTGAGGSIGSEIVRQVCEFHPERVILVDHDETHLHDLVTDLEADCEVQSVLADVRDRDGILNLFVRNQPDVVFHAAAHKHVPALETHPQEALMTNVIGTANVADAAAITSVQRFVLISTDKAIKPTSVMGASKRLTEQMIQSFQRSSCVFCAVRFGNVLGSRGSVIPTFLRQIAHGGPVTVTSPLMTRYFMSVQEAVQLVLQAAALSEGGEIFTLDMGEPVNILDLARELILLSGRVPHRDLEIVITGPRPGEKIHEDIVNPDEETLPSSHPSIVVSRPDPPDRPALRRALRQLEYLARESKTQELAAAMKSLAAEPIERVLEEIVL